MQDACLSTKINITFIHAFQWKLNANNHIILCTGWPLKFMCRYRTFL